MILAIDASVAISWIVDDERNAYADAALLAIGNDPALVPGLWHRIIANALRTLERKQRVRDALAAYADVVRLPIDVELLDPRFDIRSTLEIELARRHSLSVYHAAYLALSKKTASRPLATLDAALARAARDEGALFEP